MDDFDSYCDDNDDDDDDDDDDYDDDTYDHDNVMHAIDSDACSVSVAAADKVDVGAAYDDDAREEEDIRSKPVDVPRYL